MDYSRLMNELEHASLFDLYRLNVAVRREMENPKRIAEVKKKITLGDRITYFESNENRLIQAEVIEVRRTRVLIRNAHDMKLWNIPFYMVNLEGSRTDITYSSPARGLNINEVRVGDRVGFRNTFNKNVCGRVIRLNPKTVTVFVEPNQKWRVSYSMLYPIIEGEKAHELKFIEGTVVESASPVSESQ